MSHRSKFLLVPNSPPPPLRLEHPILSDIAGEPSKLQGAGAPKSSFGSLKNHSTKAQGLVISLTKELSFTQHSQSVLRSKDMNTKLLDGLEMFLGVFVTSLNSSKLAKGPLAELVRRTQRHSSGPGFDSPWERISG